MKRRLLIWVMLLVLLGARSAWAQGLAVGSGTITSLSVGAGAPGFLGAGPVWRFLGDGSDGAGSCSGGLSGANHMYTTFTIPAGQTCSYSGPNVPVVIRATGLCTIAGTMSVSANTGSGGTTTGGDWGGSGGGGGGGAATGTAGNTTNAYGRNGVQLTILAGGTAGGVGAAGGAGSNAQDPTIQAGLAREIFDFGYFWSDGGSAGGAGGSSGGAGGKGGQPFYLVCNTINFTGTVDSSGQAGGNSTGNSVGAGGGGAGGYVIFSAITYAANTGTINVTGGAGGTCGAFTTCGVGGPGGNGWKAFLLIQ